ncbi:MAG: enoyl-CoA hydratase-related protein [Nocardioidaceae bacterium]
MSSAETADLPSIRYDVRGGVATITLNRPQAMNSLDTPTKDLLLETVRRAADDETVRTVVLTGTGRAFCVGQDLREHVANISSLSLEEVWSTVERHYAPTAHAIATMDKPVIAAVNGVAAGAGMSLALACDLRLAADTASFNTAFTGIALSCDTGISWTLPRLVGTTRAMDLLLMPRKVDAAEALAIGLVSSVVPAADLERAVAALAARLATGPTRAYAAVKRSVAFGASHPLAETLELEARMMAWTGGSADHGNAVRSFVAKEEPTFEGT